MTRLTTPHITTNDQAAEQHHLKEFYSRLIDALHEIATPDEINFGSDRATAIQTIIDNTTTRIKKLIPLHGHAILLLNDEMALTPSSWQPAELKTKLDQVTQGWIDEGIFSWAINQNRAVVIHGNENRDTAILHVIAAHNRVMGMFVGFTSATTELDEALLAILSVALLNCSNTLEACELHFQLRQHNETLEQQVRQRTRQLELAKQQAEESVHLKSLFLATMSHEIRTPMNGVIGMAQLLSSTDLNEKQQHYTNTILQSGRALTALINDILDFSKIEAGRLEFDIHPFDMRQLSLNVIELLSFQVKNRPVEVTLTQQGDIPLYVMGDSARLRQIIINLLSNAIKFTERGNVTLAIQAEQLKGQQLKLHITVSDSGIGIDDEALTHLFTPFSQAQSSIYRKHGGTGLGLAICKQLVEQMNGSIGVVSKINQGSTFWFEITLPQASQSEVAQQDNTISTLAPHETITLSGHETGGRKPRILVAEDNPVNQEVISHMLEILGCQIKIAENGQEAIYFLARSTFDLVLMDYRMPILNGCEATEYIRNTSGKNQRIPIIALSASTLPEEQKQYMDAGMDDFISKPVELNALARMIDKWLNMNTTEAPAPAANALPQSSKTAQLLDDATLNILIQLMGQEFNALRNTFIKNAEHKIEALQQAITTNDSENIKLQAHSLKGSCGTIGATLLANQARKIEDALASGDHALTKALILELEPLFNETVAILIDRPIQK